MSWFRRRRPESAKPNAVDLFAAATDDLGRFDPVLYAALLAGEDVDRPVTHDRDLRGPR